LLKEARYTLPAVCNLLQSVLSRDFKTERYVEGGGRNRARKEAKSVTGEDWLLSLLRGWLEEKQKNPLSDSIFPLPDLKLFMNKLSY